jgi:hypothetical protein
LVTDSSAVLADKSGEVAVAVVDIVTDANTAAGVIDPHTFMAGRRPRVGR